MEWLVALITIPEGAPLVDRVVTDDTFLSPFRKGLNEESALFSQVPELLNEVHVVILDHSFLLLRSLLLFFLVIDESHFFIFNMMISTRLIHISKVICSGAKAFRQPQSLALLLVHLIAPHPLVISCTIDLGLLCCAQ